MYDRIAEEQRKWVWQIRQLSPSQPFFIAYLTHNGISNWEKFEDAIFPIDHRNVAYFEVVFDVDDENWEYVRKIATRLIETLEARCYHYYLFTTGGKGVHISVFLRYPIGFNPELDKEVGEAEVLPQDLRIAFFDYILSCAFSPDTLTQVKQSKIIDEALVCWDDMKKGHFIRAEGGKRIKDDLLTYKSMLTKLPASRVAITNPADVVIPTEQIVTNVVPDVVIRKAIQIRKKKNMYEQMYRTGDQLAKFEFKCSADATPVLAPCIQALLNNGASKGNRNNGARVLAIALRYANMRYEDALEYCKAYYEKCTHEDFNFYEVTAWLDWAYRKDAVYWSCKLPIAMGLCPKSVVPNI